MPRSTPVREPAVPRDYQTSVRERRPLAASFHRRPAATLARALLGKLLIHSTKSGESGGWIVETEAYGGEDDPASHAAPGRTARNQVMYGPAGRAYVYFTYGMHWCVNVVAGRTGRAEAVLIRALEPAIGLRLMRRRRGTGVSDRDLARGPARLCRALGIDGTQNGISLSDGPLLVARGRGAPRIVGVSGRIGIRVGIESSWRFFDAESLHVSPGRPGPAAGRRAPFRVDTVPAGR
ncbi:MAG: DNA-3-methyladenine glycosylase [Candidatus Eisenbacteria bacterium]|nr:DNA-3-methyladenine glycosylase [Candidatus Eisenbacteria bacterium]